jgi:hypothetical protein
MRNLQRNQNWNIGILEEWNIGERIQEDKETEVSRETQNQES